MSKSTRRPAGAGTICEKGPGRYLVTVSAGRRADGKRRIRSKTVYGTRQDAEIACARLAAEMGAKPNMGDTMTANEYFWGFYVPVHGKMLAKSTIERYEGVWRCHIEKTLGLLPAEEIGRAEVQRWAAELPTPATAKKAYSVLSSVLHAMYDDELVDDLPLPRKPRLPKHQVPLPTAWDADEILEAVRRLRGHRFEPIVLAFVGAGFRREEVLALHPSIDITWDTVMSMDGHEAVVGRGIVREAVTQADGRKATKTWRERPFTIAPPFAGRLKELVEGWPEDKPLLCRRDGSPLQPSSVPETWRRLFGPKGPLHGMRYVEFRTLRHAHETLASMAGVSDAVNAAVHGHSEAVSYRHYHARQAAEADQVAIAVGKRLAR